MNKLFVLKHFGIALFLSICMISANAQILGAELYYSQSKVGEINVFLVNYIPESEAPQTEFQYVKIYETFAKGSSYDLKLNLVSQNVSQNNAPTSCVIPTSQFDKVIYKGTIELNNVIGGYDIIWNSCCMMPDFINVNMKPETGFSLITHIPDLEKGEVNSSPVFVENPLMFLCKGTESLTMQIASDTLDNDSVVMKFSKAFTNHSENTNGQNMKGPENTIYIENLPYIEFEYQPGFGYDSPFGSASAKFNSNTGYYMLSVEKAGNYLFSISAEEYRNGKLLSTSQRIMVVRVNQ